MCYKRIYIQQLNQTKYRNREENEQFQVTRNTKGQEEEEEKKSFFFWLFFVFGEKRIHQTKQTCNVLIRKGWIN